MKTIKKLSALINIFAGMLLQASTVFSQSCIQIVPLAAPLRYEVQTPSNYYFMQPLVLLFISLFGALGLDSLAFFLISGLLGANMCRGYFGGK